jgi:hypothetical protein
VLRGARLVPDAEPSAAGEALAQELLANGASDILDQVRATGGGRA